jgi:preprotein translocase subunit SecB
LERTVDLAAVNRVAKRVDLTGVRLVEISAKSDPHAMGPKLSPAVDLNCTVGEHDAANIQVLCDYTFSAETETDKAIQSTIRYLLLYEVSGEETPSDSDLAEFAKANGALHSWPFVRELLYGLTSRMGFPPYTLPVMHFNTVNAPAKRESEEGTGMEKVEEPTPTKSK